MWKGRGRGSEGLRWNTVKRYRIAKMKIQPSVFRAAALVLSAAVVCLHLSKLYVGAVKASDLQSDGFTSHFEERIAYNEFLLDHLFCKSTSIAFPIQSSNSTTITALARHGQQRSFVPHFPPCFE